MIPVPKRIFFFVLSCIASFTLSCSPVHVVSTRQVPGTQYRAYQTFDFMEISVKEDSLIAVNSEAIELIKDAISHEMENLGYRHAENPDLWVNIGIVVEQKVQTRETSFREAPIYIGQRNYHWESEEVVVDKYASGTVTVDIIDTRENERVWEGVVAGTLTDNPAKMKKRIGEAMELLFNAYP